MMVRLHSTPQPRTARSVFGLLPGRQGVDAITLRNGGGLEVRIATYGARIVSIRAPDRDGSFEEVVLGFDTLEPYTSIAPFFGSVVGRFANRIAGGTFTLDGVGYALATNAGANHIHGGTHGWHTVVWAADPFERGDAAGVLLRYTSAEGEESYPGTVEARVTYTLNDRNELAIDYEASTDRPTIINLTHHSFFNLAGVRAPDILDHEVTIDANAYLPVTATMIPTGEVAPVAGTPFDFRTPTSIGARIDDPHEQLARGRGYDHNFVLNGKSTGRLRAARVVEPRSGRTLEVATTEPGLQFYTGNDLDGSILSRDGRVLVRRAGFCLEPQHYPDSPNQPRFPSTVLRPGQIFTSTTVFRFGVQP
jgi:aldose 1-epimerase